MSAREILTGLMVGLLIERPAKKKTLAEFATQFEQSGAALSRRIEKATPKPIHRRQIRHVVGIERWGQRRLRVALGEPPIHDEYDTYQPPEDASWETLVDAFRDTRQTTVELVRTLATQPIDDVRIKHNDLGPLSVRGWLGYLKSHATREALLIR